MQQLPGMSWSTNVLVSQEKRKQTGPLQWQLQIFVQIQGLYGVNPPANQELRVAHAQQRVFLSA